MSSSAPAFTEQPKPLSEAERVIDTFIAPARTFTDLRRSSNWLVPALLLIIGTLSVVWTAQSRIGFRKIVDTQLQMQPKAAERLDKLPPEDRARQLDTIVRFNQIISYCFPVILVVWLLIVAAVLLGTFNFGLGTELTFNQCIAVCMYASLPGLVKGILTIVVILLGATDNFTFQNPIASNLGGLVDPSSHFLLYRPGVGRHLHHLDADPVRHRLLLPDQGEAGHLPGGGVRMVAGVYAGVVGDRCRFLIKADPRREILHLLYR